MASFEPTYKELKLRSKKHWRGLEMAFRAYLQGIETFIRNHSYIRKQKSFEPTYKELKLENQPPA